MRCPACQFENLPGLTGCARCGSSLELATVDTSPPRASRLRVLTRLSRTWNVLGAPVLEWRHLVRPLGYLQVAPIPWRAVLRSIVPGLGQMHLGRRRLGWWLLGAWATLLLLQLPFIGSALAWLCFYLAVSVHATALLLLFGDNLSYERLWMRAAFGLAVMLGLYTLSYRPTLWVTEQMATVLPLGTFTQGATLERGDVVLVEGPWLRPARLQRGDLVAYRIETQGYGHNLIRAGYNVDRIVGVPGDVVELRDHALLVNGQRVTKRGQPLGDIPWPTHVWWYLSKDQYVIVPSRLPNRLVVPPHDPQVIEPTLRPMCLVLDRNIVGRVTCRVRPWSRLGPVE